MEDLKREITIGNAFNIFAKKAIAIVLPQLAQFVGKKVFTANGDKAKIFNIDLSKITIDAIEGMHTMVQNCYITTKHGKLCLVLKICCNGGSYDVKPATGWTRYVGVDVEIGLSKDGQIIDSIDTIENIVKLHNLDNFINLEEEIEKINTYKTLEKQAEEAKRKIKVGAEFYKYL
jgi:acyl carrier protein